jgi:hypothetical protein
MQQPKFRKRKHDAGQLLDARFLGLDDEKLLSLLRSFVADFPSFTHDGYEYSNFRLSVTVNWMTIITIYADRFYRSDDRLSASVTPLDIVTIGVRRRRGNALMKINYAYCPQVAQALADGLRSEYPQ